VKKAIHQPGKGSRPAGVSRVAAAAAAAENAAVVEALDSQAQTRVFESAIGFFHAGNFLKARQLFEQAAKGPAREMAHSARVHARMCERRIAKHELSLGTADDLYYYAVTLINERRLQQAEQHLQRALAQIPRGDHLYYAIALCRGLSGDLEGAYAHMKRAIEFEPRNRTIARNDPDFAEIGQQPPLCELLYPERTR
jgi:tetratricopeptide (TPR) repeat protein